MTNLFIAIFCFAAAAAIGLGFAVGVVVQNKSIRRFLVTLADDLKARQAALDAKVDGLKSSITAEIARVEKTISDLKLAQQGGSVSDADVQAAIDAMGVTLTNLGGLGDQLDAEDNPEVPPAASAASSS